MALVRIDYAHPKPDSFAATLALEVERTMAAVLSIPGAENYLVCQGHPPSHLLHAPGHCPPERLMELVFIQITLNQGRSPELKARFYEALNTALVATGLLKPDNIFINLVEVARENWSFGLPSSPRS